MTHPAAPSSPDSETVELPFSPSPIEELLRLFVKAVRAHQLYLPNNPVYKGAIDAVRAAFAPIWRETDEFSLKFTDGDIQWLGHPVHVESSKSPDSLPWTFFKDGVREITLTQGFEADELVRLFEILQRVRKASPDEDDLLTLLWQADFTRLRYRYVDLGAEPVAPLDAGDHGAGGESGSTAATEPSPDAVRSALHEPVEESRSAVVNMQDFDATLYFLDEKELTYLKEEIELEYRGDLRRNVASILLDIYESQQSTAIREEVSETIEHLLLLLLSAGHLNAVAYVLAESQAAVSRAAGITAEQRERMGRLPDRLSAPEPLGQMLQAMDESAELPPPEQLVELFTQLRPSALATILSWLPRLQSTRIRELVEQAGDRLAAANTGELVQLIGSPDRAVASEAARRAGAMRTASAVPPLAKMLTTPDASLRHVAAIALAEIGSAGAMQALEKAIDDDDREVRVFAVRTLGAKAHRPVVQRLEGAIKGKTLKGADLTERMAFFEAYGAMCGDAGVPYLDGVLNAKGLFGKRADAELRACAAIALGKVGTPAARTSLQKASGEKDVVVRNAVSRALRGAAPGGAT